jgi:hypothetical protein
VNVIGSSIAEVGFVPFMDALLCLMNATLQCLHTTFSHEATNVVCLITRSHLKYVILMVVKLKLV